ncbi:carbohydrate ABC transporter permease [Microbacterium sp. NPDC087589]|uniref:carbohydrate ABC transporter permease n=1 Tax=Microbacterium sp. NPDC087589 TaxID=3364191 RepID=UPI00382FFB99
MKRTSPLADLTAVPPVVQSAGAATPKSRTRARRESRTGWVFIGPFVLVFAAAFVTPIVYAIYLSLFREQMVGGTSFVGVANYTRAFTDPLFWSGLGRVSLFVLVQLPILLGVSLFLALALDSGRLYGKGFWRISIFMPYAVPGVVAALMWGFMYGTRFGLVGNINDALGWDLDPLRSALLLPAIGNIVTWEFVGYNMLIYYAALRVIDSSLYEAATIDGAGQWRIITAIKIPAIRGAIMITTIFSIIGLFQLFNEPNILQSLAPGYISTYYTPNMYAYNLSFAGQQFNYSAAIAIIMGLITVAIAYTIQVRGSRKDA